MAAKETLIEIEREKEEKREKEQERTGKSPVETTVGTRIVSFFFLFFV